MGGGLAGRWTTLKPAAGGAIANHLQRHLLRIVPNRAAVIAGNGLVGHFLFESVLNCSAAIRSICQPSPVPESAPNASEVPPRACNECGAQMKHLTDLPGAGLYPAKRIFRCYGCSFVVSERK
jgi:hypothetical protein